MLTMILKMTAATALYVIATLILWHFWRRKEKHSSLEKAAVGLLYGLFSVLSTHIGIDYSTMILNVRDLGPLAAGLFFSPSAGIISGLIGGIERYIVGEYYYIGWFTRVACGLSTFLAGLLAAGLHRWFFRGQRPSFFNCLLVGAEMEVFHMYAVLFTHREDPLSAQHVVETGAVPMILFTGLGLAACSLIIARFSGIQWARYLRMKKKNVPLSIRFQLRLCAGLLLLFTASSVLNISIQASLAIANESSALLTKVYGCQFLYLTSGRIETVLDELEYNNNWTRSYYLLVDAEKNLQLSMLKIDRNPLPIDQEYVDFIVEHAEDAEPIPTVFKPFSEELEYLCLSIHLDGPYYLIGGTSFQLILYNQESIMMETFFLEILVFTVLYLLIEMLVSRLVVQNLSHVNQSLARITDGDLNEVVSVEESVEFTQLSDDINQTVTTLRSLIDAAEKRMEEELQLAAEIQTAAMPQNFSLPPDSVSLYASMTPAKQVGGDFYDFFLIGADQLALVIADVSGKGIPAAMFMMRAKTAIKNFSGEGRSPAEILNVVNNALCDGNDTHMFVTVWLGILDLKTGLMRCANAGHEYPVLKRAGGAYTLLEEQHGFVLGGFEGISVPGYEIQLRPGDRLFVYTDGIPEAKNHGDRQFGTDRLEESLNRVKDETQQQVLTSVLADVRAFAGEAEQFDDITMLGITYIGSEPAE